VVPLDLIPLGDRAFLARFPSEDAAHSWSEAVRRCLAGEPGVLDVVLAYRSVAVFGDPERIDLDALEARLRSVAVEGSERSAGALIEVPVLYDGEDLPEVSRRLNLSEADVIARHGERDYTVFALGFLPGFPYAGYLPESLRGLPRRDSPRPRVPAGSVAIVGRQTAIYPCDSPGGWHLIGRTPLRIVDLSRGFFPIRAGDRLRFVPIGEEEYQGRLGDWLTGPGGEVT